jgi:hypothetical protein
MVEVLAAMIAGIGHFHELAEKTPLAAVRAFAAQAAPKSGANGCFG